MKLKALTEAKYAAPPVELAKFEKLLDAVAKSIPFIGYAGGEWGLADQVANAFEEAIGMSWAEWKKRSER